MGKVFKNTINEQFDISTSSEFVTKIQKDDIFNYNLLVHIIVKGIDGPIQVEFYQGHVNDVYESDKIKGYDDLNNYIDIVKSFSIGNSTSTIAIDTFFGEYGFIYVNKLGAKVGTVELRIKSN